MKKLFIFLLPILAYAEFKIYMGFGMHSNNDDWIIRDSGNTIENPIGIVGFSYEDKTTKRIIRCEHQSDVSQQDLGLNHCDVLFYFDFK